MNNRERFNKIMNYQPVDRLPVIAFEPYEKTAIERWHNEGLPADGSAEDILGMSRLIKVPAYLGPRPRFEHQVLFEDDEYIIETDTTYGAKVKKMKIAPSMYYGYIDHQVKTIDDWRRIKYRYENTMAQTVPANFEEIVENLNSSEDPVKLEIFPHFFRLGFYLMGMENFMLAFYDQPDLIHEMFSFWTDFTITMIKPFLSRVKIDILVLMEDLAYNKNPHLSPEVYREFWLPYQDILVNKAKKNNIENICIWTAGDIDVMIPMLMEHGINCLWPVERCSGNMDPITLRNKYGRGLKMSGGIPHKCLPLGPEAIDREIEKLMPLIQEGGFIPALDDMVSPEVSWENYKYYIDRLKSIRL
jgi:uroporphyrinogen decarboxylase